MESLDDMKLGKRKVRTGFTIEKGIKDKRVTLSKVDLEQAVFHLFQEKSEFKLTELE